MARDFTGFSSENLTRMLDEWSADQREREAWKDGDQSTYRFRANLLEASSQRIAALTAELEAVRRDAVLWRSRLVSALTELNQARGEPYELARALAEEQANMMDVCWQRIAARQQEATNGR